MFNRDSDYSETTTQGTMITPNPVDDFFIHKNKPPLIGHSVLKCSSVLQFGIRNLVLYKARSFLSSNSTLC